MVFLLLTSAADIVHIEIIPILIFEFESSEIGVKNILIERNIKVEDTLHP